MKKELRFLFALFFLLELTFAQQFPVRIVPRVSAPAPVNFYNYADETSLNSPVTVQIFLNDLTVASRQIRLKTYFEGGNINFTSKDFVLGSEPLFIEGGIPLTLTNTQLAPYYKLENIQGISSVVYGRPIPEGSYNFCFEVYDFASGAKLSAKQCATVFIFKNEPPILNFPQNGTNIEPTDFENIAFQWTPRHINVSNVEYEFSLVEIWDNNVNPQTAFLSQVPIYEETTRRTTLIYGPDKPQLLPGKKYAWRVKAKALQGLEEIGLFKNQGFSEIFWFSRTAPCLVPENVSAEAKGTSKINVFWDQDPTVHSEYIIAYREADNPDAHWFTKKTNSSWATIWNLKAGVTYEYKIKGKCTYQYSNYSEPQYITTDMVTNEDANYNCGIVPDAIAISNREPHPGLYIGDQITAGDFKVTLTNITSQSSGVISGNGFVSIPYLNFAKFAVTFNGILVNSSNLLAEGEIVTLYDPKFGEGASMTVDVNIDIAEAIGGDSTDKDGVKVDFVITEITIDENGALVVTGVDENGDPQEAIIPGNTDVTVTDANGDVWSYGEDGKITKGEGAEGGAVTDATTNGVDSDGEYNAITAKGVVVYFKRSGFYHFDKKPEGSYEKLDEHYKSLAYDGGKYHIGYKAISDNKGKDIIQAKVEITDSSIKRDSIIFKTKEGAKVNILRWDDATNTADLELERKFDYADEEIVAVIRSKEDPKKFDIAGSLLVTHLASDKLEPINVTLVPVFKGGSESEIKDKLSKLKTEVTEIYSKSGVRLNIQFVDNISLDQIYDWDKNSQIEVGDSNMLSNYTSSEKFFNNYIKRQTFYNKKSYYVLVTDISTNKSDVKGFMPLKRQFGFVFDANVRDDKMRAKTLAHELGHGIFGLEHPWEEFGTPEGATDFLMDNADGTVLNHLNWKKMHAPGIQIYWFQDDEDGQSTVVSSIPKEFKNSDGSYTFMTLNGSYITIPEEAKDFWFSTGLDNFDKFIDYPAGALIRFTVNDITFKAEVERNDDFKEITKEDLTFVYKGFKSIKDGHYYGKKTDENNYNKLIDNKVIALIPHYTTTTNDPYGLGGTIKSGYQLIKIPRADLTFSPDIGKSVTFNFLDDYSSISSFFSSYRSNPNPSKSYEYKGGPFSSQYELQARYVNPILKDHSWTNKHAILVKYAVLNNAQPELFKTYFSNKYGSNREYTEIFKDFDINKLKDTYVDLINFFNKKKLDVLQELYVLLENTDLNTTTLKTVESVRINQILKELTTDQYKQYLSKDQRIKALDLLSFANGTFTDYGEDNGDITTTADNEFEEQIIKLLKFVIKDEKNFVLDFLVKDNYKNFWELIYKLREKHITSFLKTYIDLVNQKDSDRVKHRTQILEKLTTSKLDDLGNKTEKVFASIISGLEDRSIDQAEIIKFLESKPEVLRNAFFVLDNFIKVEELANFVFTICSWNVKLSNSSGINEEAFKEYAEIDYTYGNQFTAKTIPPIKKEHNYIPYIRAEWIRGFSEESSEYYFNTTFDNDSNINLKFKRYGHTIIDDTYAPLEYVYVHFREDSSYENHKFTKGTGLKVPALFIHWLDDSVDDDQKMAVARIIGNILAIASAPYTFGASLSPVIVYLEVGLNVVDMFVTLNRQSLKDSGKQEFLAYWDAVFGIYSLKDIAQLPEAIVGIGKLGKGFINTVDNVVGAIKQNRVFLNPDNLESAVIAFHSLGNLEDKAKVITAIDELLYVLKYKNPLGLDNLTKQIKYRTLLKFRTKLVTEFNKKSPTIIDITETGTDFKSSLIYKGTGSDVNLGILELDINKKAVFTTNKLLPSTASISNTEDLATINNVLVKTSSGAMGVNDIKIVKNLEDGNIYAHIVGGLREDIIKLQVEDLLKLKEKYNPKGLGHNCFTCAVKFQNEFTKGCNELIEKVAKKYHDGVSPDEILGLAKEIWGFDNIKSHTALNHEDLLSKLDDIEQESVILIGRYKDDYIEDYTSHHAFNARRISNREWEVVDLQNGAKYDAAYINDKFTTVEIIEVLYKDHTYIARNILKRDLPTEVHKWIDEIPEDFLNTIKEFRFDKLQKFVDEFKNDLNKLSEFNKDPDLFEVWKEMELSPNIDVRIRTDIETLKKVKPRICKFK